MGFDRVGAVEHGGDAALGPGRRGRRESLGDQGDAVGVGQAQGQRLAGQAAADDEDVELTADDPLSCCGGIYHGVRARLAIAGELIAAGKVFT